MQSCWSKYFSKNDLMHLLQIANGCLESHDLVSFKALLYKLKKITPFDTAVCTCVELAQLPISLDRSSQPNNLYHPTVSRDRYLSGRCFKIDVSFRALYSALNFKGRFDVMERFDDGRLKIVVPDSHNRSFYDGWIYGAYEQRCNRLILFVFAGQNAVNELRSCKIIRFAVPHLVKAFKRLRHLCTASQFHLTKREYEIINLIKIGKTSWEIAKILAVSESCVNFHIENLKKKLDAVNRTQAVAIAVGKGLIKI